MTRRRKIVLGGALVFVVAVAATLVYLVRYKTDTKVTELSDGDALALLDDPVADGAGAGTGVVPEPGVYLYATTGGDAVDALGGASHEYPDTTRIVVTATACGATQRWIAAAERYDEYVTCVGDADGSDGPGTEGPPAGPEIAQVSFTEFHRFFNMDELEDYDCTGEPRPIGAPEGTTWTLGCVKEGEEQLWEGEVLGTDTLEVDGEEVAVEHVAWAITNDDERTEMSTETWYLAGSDLVVRRVGSNHTVTGSIIGDVRYAEDYEIDLLSLTPLIGDEEIAEETPTATG